MSCIDEIVDFAEFFSCTKTKKDQDSSGGTGRDGKEHCKTRDGTGAESKQQTGRDGTGRLFYRPAELCSLLLKSN